MAVSANREGDEMAKSVAETAPLTRELVLAAVAIGLVLLPFTDTHGIDVGDLPALALLVVADCRGHSTSRLRDRRPTCYPTPTPPVSMRPPAA